MSRALASRPHILATAMVLCVLTGGLVFASAPALALEGCSNEQLRSEQPFGLGLPDCRAYEMVSPVDKNDNDIATPVGAIDESLVRASVSGEAITYESYGSFARPVGARILSRYVSRRGAGGWSTQNITPQYSSFQTELFNPYESLVVTPDLSKGVVQSGNPPLTSDATVGCPNLYLADIANGSYQLVTNGTPCSEPNTFREHPEVHGASTDLSHVVFTQLQGGPLYEWVAGQLSLVSVDPGGTPMAAGVGGGDFNGVLVKGDRWHAVSNDGSRVFFTGSPETEIAEERRQLYVRENQTTTVEVSASQRTPLDPHGPQPAEYLAASVDGSKVFFDSSAELTNDANTGSEDNASNLYEYDTHSGLLTDLTVDHNAGDVNGAAVLGMATAGEDGAYVYFVAEGDLAVGAVSGQPNLYLSHGGTTTFIATLAGGDPNVSGDRFDWLVGREGPADTTVRITPDGAHLAFLSTKSLTGYNNTDANTGEPDREVFFYDAVSGSLSCVSCNPSGAQPVGPSNLSSLQGNNANHFYYTPRNFSTDGSRLFFQSSDALLPHDSNGRQDVYEYQGGHVYPISDVAGSFDSYFLDASPSGGDVFLATASQLLPQDQDIRVDVYDAKVGGGFPVSVSPPGCDNGDSCKPPASPQPAVFGAPASATFSGAGNLPPVVAAKPASKVKTKPIRCKGNGSRRGEKHGRCVRKKAKKSSGHSKKGRK